MTTTLTLTEGDVVRLKSGGPRMTIRNIYGKGFEVDWYDAANGTIRDLCVLYAKDLFERLDVVVSPPEFKIGDWVTLRSGGPEMVVVAADGDWVTARWQSGKDLNTVNLPPTSLTRV